MIKVYSFKEIPMSLLLINDLNSHLFDLDLTLEAIFNPNLQTDLTFQINS